MSPAVRGALTGLAAFGLFASHDVIVKALGGGYAAFQIVFFSVLFSFPLATIMLLRDDTKGDLRPVHPWWSFVRTAAVVAAASCAFYAFSTLPLAQVYAMLFAAPLVITVLSIPLLGEKVRLRRWLAVLVGLLGVVVVLRPWSAASGLGPGHLAALAAACLGGLASVIVRKIGREERPVVLLLYPLVGNFVMMGALMPLVYRPMPAGDLGLVALASALGFGATLLLITAYRKAPAGIVAPMQYSQILWATLYGALLFEERPDGATVLGAAIIIGSGVYILIREARSPDSQRPALNSRGRIATPGAPRPLGALAQGIDPRAAVPPSGTEHPGLRGAPGRAGRHAPPLPPGPAG